MLRNETEVVQVRAAGVGEGPRGEPVPVRAGPNFWGKVFVESAPRTEFENALTIRSHQSRGHGLRENAAELIVLAGGFAFGCLGHGDALGPEIDHQLAHHTVARGGLRH